MKKNKDLQLLVGVLATVLVAVCLYSCIWVFNHIQAWVGLALCVVLVYLLILFFIKIKIK